MSLNQKCPNEFSSSRTENQDSSWETNRQSKGSPRKLIGLTLSHAETLTRSDGGDDTPVANFHQDDVIPHLNTEPCLASSEESNNDGLQRSCSVSPYDSLWPNVAEGHKIRVLKNSNSNETFAQKLQVGVNWKNISLQSAKISHSGKEIKTSEHQPSLVSSNDECKYKKSLFKLNVGTKGKMNEPNASKLPPQDSGVHLIDGSLMEKWTQPVAVQNSQFTSKVPPQLEKDFPDLSVALKMLSKCSIKNENFEPIERKGVIDKVKSKRKSRSNQPCRKDPISVNIVDFLKETCETSKRSYLTDRRIQLRDMEKRKICGNILDSSNPIRKRGKYREKPPNKRLSKLKQVIMNERHKKRDHKEIQLCMGANKHLSSLTSVESLAGIICSNLNSLHIMNENNDEEQASSVIPALNQDDNDDKTIRHDNYEEIITPSPCHSRKFRNYCNNIRCQELDDAATNLLKEIYRFQDRHYKKDPIKAHAKRRFILGIREVKKFLMLKKLKAIIIAPDLEPVEGPGGLDETIFHIREEGKTQQVPVIFAVGRRQLGFSLRKKVPISIVGIINSEGAEELYHLMLKEWHDAVLKYQEKISSS